jgi:histidyl-tRNA synthetase
MEIAVTDLPGSLGGGGRYDNLVGMFLGRDVPACGFSLGLERMIVVMTERGMFPSSVDSGAVDVVVTFMDEDSRSESLTFASELRRRGVRAEVFPEASRKFDRALKTASSRGAKLMAIFGENERARNEVSVRDLVKREALQPLARLAAAPEIARLLGREC